MKDWNVVATVYQDGFRRAIRALRKLGPVERSPYYNVLLMKAEDPIAVLEAVERKTESDPVLYDSISRIAPAMQNLDFLSTDDFRGKAMSVLREWAQRVAGRSFHVRLHRRGAHELISHDVETFLDRGVVDLTSERGTPARVSFAEPDVVIAVDTVDNRAGLALWTREDLAKHKLLRPD